MEPKQPDPTFSDQVRQAILKCGQSRYAISRATGVDQATLSRYMAGKSELKTGTLDILFQYLGLRLVQDGPRRKKGR